MPNFGPPTPNWGFTAPTDNNDGPDFVQGIQTLTTLIDTALGGVVSKSGTYTAAAGNIVKCTGSGSFTITSPPAVTNTGFSVVQNGTGVVTVTAASGVIYGPNLGAAGVASATLSAPGSYVTLMSDGTNWLVVAGGLDAPWTTITSFASPFSAGTSPAPQVRLENNGTVARIRGEIVIASGSVGNGALMFTLPAGFRPSVYLAYAVLSLDGSSSYFLGVPCPIDTSGTVTYAGAPFTSFGEPGWIDSTFALN